MNFLFIGENKWKFLKTTAFIFLMSLWIFAMFHFTGTIRYKNEFNGCFTNIYRNGSRLNLSVIDGYIKFNETQIQTAMYTDKSGFSLLTASNIFVNNQGIISTGSEKHSLIKITNGYVELFTENGSVIRLNKTTC